MSALEVLSLSVNNISTLKDIGQCSNLQELYIRRNAVCAISELNYLKSLAKLRILWLDDNPVASTPNYRAKVIQELPQLTKLDNQEITFEERQNALSEQPQANNQADVS